MKVIGSFVPLSMVSMELPEAKCTVKSGKQPPHTNARDNMNLVFRACANFDSSMGIFYRGGKQALEKSSSLFKATEVVNKTSIVPFPYATLLRQ